MSLSATTTRRDFLRGQPMAGGAENLFDPLTPATLAPCSAATPSRHAVTGHSLLCAGRRAMGCSFEVLQPATTPKVIEAMHAALDEIDRLEDQMTVYRETSELSRINLLAAVARMPVEPRLFGLLEYALQLTKDTDGAFDVAAGALIKAWGFLRGPKRVPAAAELASVMQRVGSRHVSLDRASETVHFTQPGVELNLGAIGKGYALDRAGELLRRDWSATCALLHGGRSSVLALGSPPASEGWILSLVHPYNPERSIATVRLQDAALGTSGATFQYFEAAGRRWGHILDPRTGWPAESASCVSVIAPTAATADALSTAFFLLGADKVGDYCRTHPEIGAVVATARGERDQLEFAVFGRACGLVQIP